MNVEDFSKGFDTLLNSYALRAGFGSTDHPGTIELDEYEKSQFLTWAQEDVVLSLYNGKNPYGESLEETEELRRYLDSLVDEKSYIIGESEAEEVTVTGLSSYSLFFPKPNNLWFIIYESLTVNKGDCGYMTLEVVPIRHDEYHRLKKNPFRGSNSRRALRLDCGSDKLEVIPDKKYEEGTYYLRYLKTLSPIILVDLDEGNDIYGVSNKTECQLHESLHQKILERAVLMALQSRGYSVNNNNNENR